MRMAEGQVRRVLANCAGAAGPDDGRGFTRGNPAGHEGVPGHEEIRSGGAGSGLVGGLNKQKHQKKSGPSSCGCGRTSLFGKQMNYCLYWPNKRLASPLGVLNTS